jgi:hypothetical protein
MTNLSAISSSPHFARTIALCVLTVLVLLLATRPGNSQSDSPAASAPPASPPGNANAAPPAQSKALPAPPPLTMDLVPYRVLIGLSVQSRPRFGREFREDLVADLRRQAATRAGAFWRVDVGELPWLQPGCREVLASLSDQELTQRFLPMDFDKVLLAVVEEDGGGVRYSCREWDKSSQTATATTSRVTFDRRLLPDLLFAEMLTHFRPLAEVETVDEGGKTLEMRIRAGELFPPDPAVLRVATGAYFSPYFRSFDRKGELQSLQHLPWTYVRIN